MLFVQTPADTSELAFYAAWVIRYLSHVDGNLVLTT